MSGTPLLGITGMWDRRTRATKSRHDTCVFVRSRPFQPHRPRVKVRRRAHRRNHQPVFQHCPLYPQLNHPREFPRLLPPELQRTRRRRTFLRGSRRKSTWAAASVFGPTPIRIVEIPRQHLRWARVRPELLGLSWDILQILARTTFSLYQARRLRFPATFLSSRRIDSSLPQHTMRSSTRQQRII